ncbi:MAG: shikimate kinase [Flavobacteriales bacterium]|nr:shikimate kinase [Flavobacteriales bacterium]
MSLFLVGYMGSGKSSVGRRLANRLELEFVDMDDAIEEYAQASVQDIFAKSGEETFRLLETHILDKLIAEGPRVIATGGGSPCHSGNMDKILNSGISVYLKLAPAKLQRRISQSNKKNPNKRPLVANLQGQDLLHYIIEHLEEREPYYEEADMTINADKVNSAMLDKIKKRYEEWVRSN